jgi:two-component system LytT family response regulator
VTVASSLPHLRTLIVDDEPLALDRLRIMLADHAEVEIVGECSNGVDAMRAARELRPDLILLDIRMPGTGGFRVVEALSLVPRPFVVFVTAHPEHAVRAFDVDAVDYLLKPYDDERLAQSLDKALRAAATRSAAALATEVRALSEALTNRLTAVSDGTVTEISSALTNERDSERMLGERAPAESTGGQFRDRLSVKVGTRTVFVRVPDIEWIEAAGNYACLHCGPKRYLLRATLGALERELDGARFVRVHRSAIVQVAHVLELRQRSNGDYQALMRGGATVPVKAKYRRRLCE